jgi:uncharacterized protein YoxC
MTKMEVIPPEFWMIVVSVITIMLCSVLYYLSVLLKEVKEKVSKTDPIIKDIQTSVSSVTETVNEVNDLIVKPVKGIGAVASVINGIATGIKSVPEEKK